MSSQTPETIVPYQEFLINPESDGSYLIPRHFPKEQGNDVCPSAILLDKNDLRKGQKSISMVISRMDRGEESRRIGILEISTQMTNEIGRPSREEVILTIALEPGSYYHVETEGATTHSHRTGLECVSSGSGQKLALVRSVAAEEGIALALYPDPFRLVVENGSYFGLMLNKTQ